MRPDRHAVIGREYRIVFRNSLEFPTLVGAPDGVETDLRPQNRIADSISGGESSETSLIVASRRSGVSVLLW